MKNVITSLPGHAGTNMFFFNNERKSIYNILMENDIVYPIIEELNEKQWVNIKPTKLFISPSEEIEINKLFFNGKALTFKINFQEQDIYFPTFITREFAFLKILSESTTWECLSRIKYDEEITCFKDNHISSTSIVSIKQDQVRPTWSFSYYKYFSLANGTIIKQAQIERKEPWFY